jgi:hypothetical protein
MTEDQVKQLVSLSRDVAHILEALDAMRQVIGKLATKDELAAMVSKREHDLLSYRVQTLEAEAISIRERLKEQSASSIMDRLQKVAVTLTTVAAACGVVAAIVLHFTKV